MEQARGGRGKEHCYQVSSDGEGGGGGTTQGGTARRTVQTRALIGAAPNWRDWQRRRRGLPQGGRGGKERRGRQRRGGCRKSERESYLGTRWPAGATPVNPPPRPPKRRERRAAMGKGRQTEGGLEAGRKIRPGKTRECGATTGDARPPEWPMIPPEWGAKRGGARPTEWRKTHGIPAREWERGSSCHRSPTPP